MNWGHHGEKRKRWLFPRGRANHPTQSGTGWDGFTILVKHRAKIHVGGKDDTSMSAQHLLELRQHGAQFISPSF